MPLTQQIFIDSLTDTKSKANWQGLTKHQHNFNSYAYNARGIVVVKKTHVLQLISLKRISYIIPGKLTKFTFIFDKQTYVILALYGPRKDDVNFFEKVLADHIIEDTHLVTFISDWNITLSQLLDPLGYLHENNVKNKEYVKDQMKEKELLDIWRVQDEGKFDYMWSRKQWKNRNQAQLNFLLTLANMI